MFVTLLYSFPKVLGQPHGTPFLISPAQVYIRLQMAVAVGSMGREREEYFCSINVFLLHVYSLAVS